MIYSFLYRYQLSIDEYYDLAAIGLCKGGLTFDDEKSNFSTYAYKCMYTTVFNEIRNNNADKRIPENKIVYYDSETINQNGDSIPLLNFIPSNENIEDDVLTKVIYDKYGHSLKEKEKVILEMLKSGYKQCEIAHIMGCSRQNISRIKTGLYRKLKH